MKKNFVFLCLGLLLIQLLMPAIATEVSDAQQAIVDARRDAGADANTTSAFLWGTFCGLIGVAIVHAEQPTVPVHKNMGKTPEYISFYSDEYKRVVKSNRNKNSWYGCLLGGCLVLVLGSAG